MLHEFAVDPEALASWEQFRYLTEKFGIEHGRLISKFPKHWKRSVYAACSGCRDVERTRIEEGLRRIDDRMIWTGRPYGSDPAWLVNAENEHARLPFRAIISAGNPRSRSFVLLADKLDETAALWTVSREAKVARNATALGSCVQLLFRVSRSIFFVDPHFKPDTRRYYATLSEMLRAAERSGNRFNRIEYHVKHVCEISIFMDDCRRYLLNRVPRDWELTFFRWSPRSPGEAMHARYILTEVGGLRVDHGLDEGGPGETTDVSILDRVLHSDRLNDYLWPAATGSRTVYDLVDRIRIIGGREVVELSR